MQNTPPLNESRMCGDGASDSSCPQVQLMYVFNPTIGIGAFAPPQVRRASMCGKQCGVSGSCHSQQVRRVR